MAELMKYRIEHRKPGAEPRRLGTTDAPWGTGTAALEKAKKLADEGESGIVVLVERATGAVVGCVTIEETPRPC